MLLQKFVAAMAPASKGVSNVGFQHPLFLAYLTDIIHQLSLFAREHQIVIHHFGRVALLRGGHCDMEPQLIQAFHQWADRSERSLLLSSRRDPFRGVDVPALALSTGRLLFVPRDGS